MWSFGNPKSSTAVIIIAILLFAEMNAIASLKLQSYNNNRARRNPFTADTKCCPNIGRRRAKRFITLDIRTGRNGPNLHTEISSFPTITAAGVIGAGFGFGAALIAAAIGGFWKTGTSSSQTVQAGGANSVLPMGGGTYYLNGGNSLQHHSYYYYFPPPYYYYHYYYYYG